MNNRISLNDEAVEAVIGAIGINIDHSKGENGTLGIDPAHNTDYCFADFNTVKNYYMTYHPTLTDQQIIDKMLAENIITVNTNK